MPTTSPPGITLRAAGIKSLPAPGPMSSTFSPGRKLIRSRVFNVSGDYTTRELSRVHARSDGHGRDHLRLAHRHPRVNAPTMTKAPITIPSVFNTAPLLGRFRR